MTKRQDLYLQRRSRSEQSDQRQPNQAKSISHEPRASPDSTALTSRIEFPTMTDIHCEQPSDAEVRLENLGIDRPPTHLALSDSVEGRSYCAYSGMMNAFAAGQL